MEYDKRNGNIVFAEGPHKYWDLTNPSAKFISVTTLIEKYGQPFNKEFWSMYKALETFVPKEDWKSFSKPLRESMKIPDETFSMYDFTKEQVVAKQQEILDDWQKKNQEACIRGTAIHAELENSMYKQGKNCTLKQFGIGGKFICDKGRTTLDLEDGVYPEYLISRVSDDGLLRLAGQIDLLVKKGNTYSVLDYKTNSSIDKHSYFDSKTKGRAMMKYPLNHIEDSNYWHYTLQLSTYAWMIQMMDPNAKIDRLILSWYPHEGGNQLFELDYLKKDVTRMLAYYKKQLIHEQNELKYKEIEY